KLNNGVYCYAKIQVPLDGSIALAEEKILNQLLEQPERELQVEYPENGSTDPCANGYSNGSIKVKIWGGTPNADGKYNVQWTNGNDVLDVSNIEIKDEVDEQGRVYKANYLTLSNIPLGTYYLTVTDDNFDDATDEQGCTIINSEWTLNQPEPLSIEIEESKSISCYGETGGELIAHAEGGVELEVTDNGGLPYYYTWKKKNEEGNWITLSETSEKLSDIGSGVYAVNIKDAKGIIIGRSENNVVVEPEDVTYTLTEPELLEIKHNSKIDVY